MQNLMLANYQLDAEGYWNKPLPDNFYPRSHHLDLFDQNGYDLTELEKLYAQANHAETNTHRSHRTAIKRPWFMQKYQDDGAILNHSLLFERKGYAGDALSQLRMWSKSFTRAYQLISLRPKWGLDFSMDYVDYQGNCFELLHWEFDGFDYQEIQAAKNTIEPILLNIDWNDAAQHMIRRKDEWHHLDFFGQSDWKCNYFGVPRERFKMVAWD